MFGRAPRLRQESLRTKVGWDVLGWGKVGGKGELSEKYKEELSSQEEEGERGGGGNIGWVGPTQGEPPFARKTCNIIPLHFAAPSLQRAWFKVQSLGK